MSEICKECGKDNAHCIGCPELEKPTSEPQGFEEWFYPWRETIPVNTVPFPDRAETIWNKAQQKTHKMLPSKETIESAIWWVENGLQNADMDHADYKKTQKCRDELTEYLAALGKLKVEK